MSPMTWRRVEESRTVRGLTYSGVENALEWPNGSIRNYLAGGEAPAPVERPSRPANAPTIFEATWDQLLSEVDRRYRYAIQAHHRPKTDGSSGLVLPAGEETAESVRAQGMLPGRPMRDEEEDHASEDQTGDEGEDHASGGHT